MLVAFLAPAVLLSVPWSGLPVPQIAHANALWQIQGLEETLLDQDLADPAFMKPMLTPFISLSATNVLGVILGLAAGLACLPPALALLRGASAREARWSLVWALALAALFLTAAPALAAYAKYALLALLADRTPIAQLPAWMFTYGKLGLVEICGYPAVDAATTVAACATLPDPTAVLRLQDIDAAARHDRACRAGDGRAHSRRCWDCSRLPRLRPPSSPRTVRSPPIIDALARPHARQRGSADGGESRLLCARRGSRPRCSARRGRAAREPADARDLGLYIAGAGLLPALVAGLWWRRANALAHPRRSSPGLRCAPSIFSARAISRFVLRCLPVALERRSDRARYVHDLQQAWAAATRARRRMPPGRRSMRTRRRSPIGGASSPGRGAARAAGWDRRGDRWLAGIARQIRRSLSRVQASLR